MASGDATPLPIKNQAFRVTFPIYDNDADLVTGAAGLDSEVSKDGGTFADCTNEATEIATASGIYFLDLSATEMNADTVAIIVKTSTLLAKTTVIVLYPAENTDIPVNLTAISGDTAAADNLESYTDGTTPIPANATQLSGDSTAADNAEAFFDGTGYAGTNNVIPTVTTVNGLAANTITATSIAADAITAAKIATGAIDADALAADAVAEIADGVWDEDATGHQTQGTFGQAIGDPVADSDTIWGLVNTNLDAAVSSRLATAGYTAPDNSTISTINTKLGTPAGVSVSADIADVEGKVDDLESRVGTPSDFGSGATVAANLVDLETLTDGVESAVAGLNNLSQAQAQTAATNALTAYDPPTHTELVSEVNSVQADIAALNNLSAAQVNAEVVDALATDTYAEPSSVPAATASLKDKIGWLMALARNRLTQTSTTQTLRNDANSATIATASVSDDGTTFVRNEWS